MREIRKCASAIQGSSVGIIIAIVLSLLTSRRLVAANEVRAAQIEFAQPVDLPGFDGLWFEVRYSRIGTIRSDPYRDWDLVLAKATCTMDCGKGGPRRDDDLRIRYAKKGNHWVLLSRLTHPSILMPSYREYYGMALAPSRSGTSSWFIDRDDEFSWPQLEYPETLSGPRPGQSLKYIGEQPSVSDASILVPSFVSQLYGTVYTTAPGRGPMESFYYGKTKYKRPTIINCRDTECLVANGFLVYRPDGTMLLYAYVPPVGTSMVHWKDGHESSMSDYSYRTSAGCLPGDAADFTSIVPDGTITMKDLKTVGFFGSSDQLIYAPKDSSHRLYTDFYNNYKAMYGEWREDVVHNHTDENPYGDEQPPFDPISFGAFVSADPLFLWRDPFGRWMRFQKRKFLPICH